MSCNAQGRYVAGTRWPGSVGDDQEEDAMPEGIGVVWAFCLGLLRRPARSSGQYWD